MNYYYKKGTWHEKVKEYGINTFVFIFWEKFVETRIYRKSADFEKRKINY